jgi:hypothetical protein
MPRRVALAVLAVALGGVVALPAAPASAGAGPACDAINAVCQKVVFHGQCVG